MKVVKPESSKEDVGVKDSSNETANEAATQAKKETSPFIAPKQNNNPNQKLQKVVTQDSEKDSKEALVKDKPQTEVASKVKDSGVNANGISTETLNNSNPTGNGVLTASPGPNAKTVSPELKEGDKEQDKKEEKDQKKESKADKENKIPKAPTKPEDDPEFQAQIKATEAVKEEKSQHPDPNTKVTEQQEAGHASPATQTTKNNQQAHATSMEATSEEEKKREPFTPASFKKLLEKNLDDLENQLPRNSDEAQDFRDDKPIEGIKKNISGQVTSESDKLAGPMKQEADKPAPDSGQPTLEAQPLPVADPGAPPKPLNAQAAIPKPKTNQEISMEKESQSLDDYMSENEVTDEQLAKSNEPKFTGALDEKNNAQTEAKLAPVKYRKKEQAQLGAAEKTATTTSQEGLDQMQAAKLLSENTVLTNQTTNKTSDKTEQEKIYAEFEAIYNETKQKVTDSLEKLSEDVDKKFSEEAESAQKMFEKNVEDGLGEIYGWTVVDDWIFGEDTEAIDRLFRSEKRKFVSKMNTVLDDISVIIADGLNGALQAIEDGKKKSKEKFDSLDDSQKKLAEDAYNDFNDQYADLEDSVYEKQEELASDLAQSYKENVDVLQEKFDEIKEKVSAGWIGAAFNALAGVIKTILKIKDLLLNLLSAAVSAIGAIISDPIGFLGNLISGIKQGFVDFGSNIKQHMIKGLIEWLTGSLGNVGITMPDNLFSLSGIFSLVTQMLGLTWDYFRSKAVKLLGEPVVNGMEKAVEVFQIVKKDGVTGLWEYIKDQFTNLKEMVMDAIRDMIITKVIEAGIKWIMGLLSPAGAFVKAAMMIIDIVKFFVERAAQIFELVTAFINSIKALAAGNVKAVAKGIETALAKALPVLISFLAALVGVTGLTGKIQKIIKKVRKKIDKAINKIILKAKKAFKNLVKKGKAKVKGAVKKIFKWLKLKRKFKTRDGKNHKLFLEKKGGKTNLMVASKKKKLSTFLTEVDARISGKEDGEEKQVLVTARGKVSTHLEKAQEIVDDLQLEEKKSAPREKRITELDYQLREEFKVIAENLIILGLDPENSNNIASKLEVKSRTNGRPSKVVGDPITPIAGNTKGSPPVRGQSAVPPGWGYLVNYETTKGLKDYVKHNWVRFHIIHESLHGPGNEEWNLVPTRKGPNKLANLKAEKKALKLVRKPEDVIWYQTTLDYNHTDHPDFPSNIEIQWAKYKIARNGNMTKGKINTSGPIPVDAPPEMTSTGSLPIYKILGKAKNKLRSLPGFSGAGSGGRAQRINNYYNTEGQGPSSQSDLETFYEQKRDFLINNGHELKNIVFKPEYAEADYRHLTDLHDQEITIDGVKSKIDIN
ncbi:hypothetical protein ACOSP6_13985 [Tenacibaculum sp. MEBiC06402]|uniref:hypothetical protein n=1 Tax=unclassified Tenacibaculum TaxID=2635139 RepID=UPI003B9BD272